MRAPLFARAESAIDAYGVADDADPLVIFTAWDESRGLDLEKRAKRTRGRVLVDLPNNCDPEEMKRAGLEYRGIGRAARADPGPRGGRIRDEARRRSDHRLWNIRYVRLPIAIVLVRRFDVTGIHIELVRLRYVYVFFLRRRLPRHAPCRSLSAVGEAFRRVFRKESSG